MTQFRKKPVVIGFRIGDIYPELFTYERGEKAGQQGVAIKGRLLKIGFAKVDVPAGEARRVTFRVHADRTSFTGVDRRRIVEPGEIRLSVGRSSEDRGEPVSVEITGQRRVVGEGRVLTTPVVVETPEAPQRG